MIRKATRTPTFICLSLTTAAVIGVYFWSTSSIPYLHLSKAKVPASEPTSAYSSTWTSAPDIHYHPSDAKKTSIKKTSNSSISLLMSKDMYQQKKVHVPSLPTTLPYATRLKSTQNIQQASWTTELYVFLKSLNQFISPHVNMVFGDSHHLDLVLNWIIAAHLRLNPPLHNIMVLSVDQPLCDLLASKKLQVTCIAVPSESILASTGNVSYEQGIKSRLIVLRVINFWGYDVASYDSDAIILRNPQHLYDSNPDVQVFGGASYLNRGYAKRWGITDRLAVSGGTFLVKSHPSTENLWKNIHESTIDCEQCLFNHALKKLGLRESKINNIYRFCKSFSGWHHHNPPSSMVFPQNIFCRECCGKKGSEDYYVVHPNSNHVSMSLKRQRLTKFSSWFLRDNWRNFISSSLEGNEWLKKMTCS